MLSSSRPGSARSEQGHEERRERRTAATPYHVISLTTGSANVRDLSRNQPTDDSAERSDKGNPPGGTESHPIESSPEGESSTRAISTTSPEVFLMRATTSCHSLFGGAG